MKTKTIQKVINKKFDDWMASIDDLAVREKIENGAILTGGAIASMLLQQPVNDFDFYFKDKETAKAAAEYYVRKFNEKNIVAHGATNPVTIEVRETQDRVKIFIRSAGIAGEGKDIPLYQYFESRPPEDAEEFVEKTLEAKKESKDEEKPDFRPVFMSGNAVSLAGGIQMVIRFYGTPDQIHENYDFAHATNYWTSWERKVTLRTEALECLLTKELRYIGSKYPICSLVRARKFIQRDFTINAGQFLKISLQIHELNLKDFAVLEEQLVGMDVAYFAQVLAAVKDKDPTLINAAYLCEIIDRIFG